MLEIVIYAVIAVLLFARLWSVLGERQEDEPQNPNPFVRKLQENKKDEQTKEAANRAGEEGADTPALPEPSAFRPAPPPLSLAGRLEAVRQLDPSFEEKSFLQGAKSAFGMIVKQYAAGDLAPIERLLAPQVLFSFRQALKARQEEGVTLETDIKEIKEADIETARTEGSKVYVTVSFISCQTNVMRAKDGSIKEGSETQVEEIRDVWTFTRDTRSDDPNWQLVETKS